MMADYHPNSPPDPSDGPVWVDDTQLEEEGHTTLPDNVTDLPNDGNLVIRTDLVEEARELTEDEQVDEVLTTAGNEYE